MNFNTFNNVRINIDRVEGIEFIDADRKKIVFYLENRPEPIAAVYTSDDDYFNDIEYLHSICF